MQLGFLRIERPPDIQSYFPSFLLGKKISISAESDVGRCPKNLQAFEKAWAKLLTTVAVGLCFFYTVILFLQNQEKPCFLPENTNFGWKAKSSVLYWMWKKGADV